MLDIVAKHKAEHAQSVVGSMDECKAWSDSEELFVGGSDSGLMRASMALRCSGHFGWRASKTTYV